ncbi:MAG TPA: hypothetical protein VKG43_01815 [Acidimicrobiales bacterium]|nr:hypothetical protein [Acidimicrobiales bacterium]
MDEMVQADQGGEEVGALAARFAVDRTTVLAHLKRRGIRRRRTRLQTSLDGVIIAE